jgi:hypothetical protein
MNVNMRQALRTPRDMIPWLPESQYVVPSNRDNLPTAAEGQRRQTNMWECYLFTLPHEDQ